MVVEQSREGQILTSIPGIGTIQAAVLIAAIGNILNFENAAALKAYFGWAPTGEFSGTTLDRVHLTHGGTRPVKQILYLCVASAIQLDCEWAKLYERLVPRKYRYDERKRAYRGKIKVIGRIAGQMTEMIYAFLKQDAEIMSTLLPDEPPPSPLLYDPAVHQRHRNGGYQPIKNTFPQRKVMHLPAPFQMQHYVNVFGARCFQMRHPLADAIDFEFWGRQFELAGGNIRNVVVASAFLAAEEGSTIGMEHLVISVARELRKMGKMPLQSNFQA